MGVPPITPVVVKNNPHKGGYLFAPVPCGPRALWHVVEKIWIASYKKKKIKRRNKKKKNVPVQETSTRLLGPFSSSSVILPSLEVLSVSSLW